MHAITASKLDEAMEYIDVGHALLARRFFAVILLPMRPGSSTRYQLQARVVSILASQTSAHVLDEATVALPDTNDAFLGNIQRNGTYSVAPLWRALTGAVGHAYWCGWSC